MFKFFRVCTCSQYVYFFRAPYSDKVASLIVCLLLACLFRFYSLLKLRIHTLAVPEWWIPITAFCLRRGYRHRWKSRSDAIFFAMVKRSSQRRPSPRIPARSVDGANVKRFDVAISSFTTPSSDDAAFFPFTRSFWVSVLFLLERLELPTRLQIWPPPRLLN